MEKLDRQIWRTQAQLVRWSDLIREIAVQGGAADVIYDYASRISALRAKHALAESQLEVLGAAGSSGTSRERLYDACNDFERALTDMTAV